MDAGRLIARNAKKLKIMIFELIYIYTYITVIDFVFLLLLQSSTREFSSKTF